MQRTGTLTTPPPTHTVHPTFQLSPRVLLETGDIIKLRDPERGEFTFQGHAVHGATGHEWIEVNVNEAHGAFRSVTIDKVTRRVRTADEERQLRLKLQKGGK